MRARHSRRSLFLLLVVLVSCVKTFERLIFGLPFGVLLDSVGQSARQQGAEEGGGCGVHATTTTLPARRKHRLTANVQSLKTSVHCIVDFLHTYENLIFCCR